MIADQMEKGEAKLRLLELRKDVDDFRNKPTASYFELQKLAGRLLEVAEGVFGPTSAERDEARISLLSPEQLKRLEGPLRKVRIIHKKDRVTQIIRAPDVLQHEYYRKAVSQVDEAIVAMLYSLR